MDFLVTELKNSRNLNMKVLTFKCHKGNTAFYEKLPILHKIPPASWSLSTSNIIGHIYIRRDQSPSGSILGSNVPICVRLQEIQELSMGVPNDMFLFIPFQPISGYQYFLPKIQYLHFFLFYVLSIAYYFCSGCMKAYTDKDCSDHIKLQLGNNVFSKYLKFRLRLSVSLNDSMVIQ